jgi:hypothetical protein
MKRFSLVFCHILILLFVAVFARAQTTSAVQNKEAIKGVWTITEMDLGSGDSKETTTPKAFMLFILDKYYSSIRDLSQQAGSTSSGGAYGTAQSFNADAGTYEFDGSTLVVHHMASMMGPGSSMTFGCKMEGNDTLILTPQYDKLVMPGMGTAPSAKGKVPSGAMGTAPSAKAKMSSGGMAVRYKFKRLE